MLTDNDMPASYQAANEDSMSAQRDFFRLTKFRLGGLLLAAAGSGLPGRLGGAVALFGFVAAILAEVTLFKQQPERRWWEGRAIAESAKTLAWRYSVGGHPFPMDQSDEEVDQEFLRQLRVVRKGLESARLIPTNSTSDQITSKMRTLREMTFHERLHAYRDGRLQDQFEWYSRKARWNDDRAKLWMWVLLIAELLGAALAVGRVANLLDVDLFGLVAAAVAVGTAWLQAKQHETLTQAYAVASQELADAKSELPRQSAMTWANFVDQAEQAISREHTRWSAQRGVKLPLESDLRTDGG